MHEWRGWRLGALSQVKRDGNGHDGVAMYSSVAAKDAGKGGQVNEFSSVVTDIREESRVAGRQRWQMTLDRTEFVAGDVGVLEAVARRGAKLVVPVLAVVMDAVGEVWHVVEKPLAAGTKVKGRVSE